MVTRTSAPPFARDTATEKVRLAEDCSNTRLAARIAAVMGMNASPVCSADIPGEPVVPRSLA